MRLSNVIRIGALVTALSLFAAPASGDDANRPANDDVAGATVIQQIPFTDTADLRGAGLELGEPLSACGRVKSSVWYRFTPSTDAAIVAEMWSGFKSTLGIYTVTSPGPLAEIACDGAGTSSKIEFDGGAGDTFLIRLGAVKRAGGVADFKLSPSHWQQKTLAEVSQPIVVSDTGTAQVHIQGQPRPSDPAMYDISVTAADQPTFKRGLLTFGLVRQKIDLELVRIPRQSTQVDVTLAYRYNSSQYACITDDDGGQCTGKAPIRDLNWLTGGDASRAELMVGVRVWKDEKVVAERMVTIPYAGQLVGLP